MSTNLRKLIKRRNTYKASINQIKDFVEAYNSNLQSTRQVSTRLSKLNDLMDSFARVQDDIIELDEGEDQEDEYLKYQDIYCSIKADMEDIIAKHGVPETAASTNLSRSSVCDSIRLPTIKPPEFNGSLEDWASFIDTFNALFHNNSSLSDVQRLHYLKTSVSGPAADIIKNFTITAENYTAAYNEDVVNPILEKFSGWMPLIRTTGWMLRFIHNAKIPSHNHVRRLGPLTVRELHDAQMLSSGVELRRPVAKVALLPLADEEDHSI
ncbi:hypothetical protein ACI65C_005226 [Semiaphis heraclei]